MKLGITGSRSVQDGLLVKQAIEESRFDIDEIDKIIHGGAGGVDSHADRFAALNDIEVETVRPVNPNINASYLDRNTVIVDKSDAIIAVWGHHVDDEDKLSNGTEDTIKKAVQAGKDVYIKSAIQQ